MNPKIFWTIDSVDKAICHLALPDGRQLIIQEGLQLEHVLEAGCVDGLLIEGFWGFNDLGGYGRLIAKLLGTTEETIQRICSATQSSSIPTVAFIPSTLKHLALKGIALVPTQNHPCYERWATPIFGRPYRDFYYNVAYEGMYLLAKHGCTSIGIAGLTASLAHYGHPDVGNCVAQAAAHIAIEFAELDRVTSTGYGPVIVKPSIYMNAHPDGIGEHRLINTRSFSTNGVVHTQISWSQNDAEFTGASAYRRDDVG